MHPGMLVVAGVVLAASLLLTPAIRRLALRRGWYDLPDDPRRVHTVPTPRIGGLAIYLAFMIGLGLTLIPGIMPTRQAPPIGPPEGWRVGLLALGATIITAVMLVDDIRGLKPRPKLFWQIFVAGLVMLPDPSYLTYPGTIPGVPNNWLTGVIVSFVQNPFGDAKHLQIQLLAPLAILFTFFWIVGMMNAVNFMDGLDGLAGGVTGVACVVLFVVSLLAVDQDGVHTPQTTIAYLPLILGCAVLGFLRYNFHPAQIFMGDSGSMFLGFTLAVISIIGGAKIATALLVLAVPILDVAFVIIFRVLRGRSPLQADRGHLHHRLYDLGLGQRLIAGLFYVVCGSIGFGLAFLPPGSGLIKLGVLALIALVLGSFLILISRHQFDRSSRTQ
ncbi:MAG TPA: MraY family glycosyltransferase [Chloroflexia bacterium]|nr:MraY family glycosyltransferase [Chloroflexia bacterium]